MNKKAEQRLRRVMETLNGFIADATVSLEYSKIGVKPDFPGDPTVMQAATRLSQLETVRAQLIETFPFLESVPKPNISGLLGKQPSG